MKMQTRYRNLILFVLLGFFALLNQVSSMSPTYSKYTSSSSSNIHITSLSNPVTKVTIDGIPRVGVELVANVDPTGVTSKYQWFHGDDVDGFSPISGAEMSTYTPSGSDLGKYIKVQASGINVYSWSGVATVGPVDWLLESVTINGIPRVGETLTTSIIPGGATATYQWYSDNTEVSGSVFSTYTPSESDLGKDIKVVAMGSGYYSGTKDSTVGPVASQIVVINDIVIDGIQPFRGGTPIFSIDSIGYHASISWSPNDFTGQGQFKNNTAYTATIIVTPKTGYSIAFGATVSVIGATGITTNFALDSVTITAVFLKT